MPGNVRKNDNTKARHNYYIHEKTKIRGLSSISTPAGEAGGNTEATAGI